MVPSGHCRLSLGLRPKALYEVPAFESSAPAVLAEGLPVPVEERRQAILFETGSVVSGDQSL